MSDVRRFLSEMSIAGNYLRHREHMGSVERTREIRRRRSRKVKLKKLRTRYAAATNEADKHLILEKARRVSPLVSFDAE
ncbi:MAG: DUF6800 family protein [Planctomycetales bacterium]